MEKLIRKDYSLGEVVTVYPAVVKKFNDMELDYCCGGNKSLEVALKEKGVDVDKFVEDLNKEFKEFKFENSQYVDWREKSSEELIRHIVETHHAETFKLLKEIEKVYGKHNKTANTLIQVNIGREEQKYGILEEELDELIEAIEACNNVNVLGIMTIIPKGTEEECRKYFRRTHKLFSELKEKKFKNIKMEILSMGMSGDYEVAIEEGSNMVRIGQGIFGKRLYK